MLHGDLVNQTEANRGSFPLGTLLMYSCDPGFVPEGASSVTCVGSGEWSHQSLRCIRSNGEGHFTPCAECSEMDLLWFALLRLCPLVVTKR